MGTADGGGASGVHAFDVGGQVYGVGGVKCTFVKEPQQWHQARYGAGDSWVLDPLLSVLSVGCLAFIVFLRKTKTIDQSKNY